MAMKFLSLTVRNFWIHAEFPLNNGKPVPIELNPPRFGHGTGLVNVGFYAFRVNACKVHSLSPAVA
jgi:hypothetical protein